VLRLASRTICGVMKDDKKCHFVLQHKLVL